jgi:hypothetical protein
MRAGGAPAYVVSLRPLARAKTRTVRTDADVMVLVRDPLSPNEPRAEILQELFKLTRALCNGVTRRAYATGRHVTLNTVYSHHRTDPRKSRLQERAWIRKFGEWNVPLRLS